MTLVTGAASWSQTFTVENTNNQFIIRRSGNFDFVDGQMYNVQGVINIKEPWANPSGISPMDYDYPFQNYTIKATSVDEVSPSTDITDIYTTPGTESGRYNLLGQPVGKDYKGVVIEKGKKILVK